jgi:dipeptide/tripeptide permease
MGAVPAGSQGQAGGLGLGEQVANASSQSFALLAYVLPILTGYFADTKTGRFNMIW